MEELPEEFWLSIRHISSFKNKKEYEEYLKIKIELWEKQLKSSQA